MFQFSKDLQDLSARALDHVQGMFRQIDDVTEYNQKKVLEAFINNKVSEAMFVATTGYGLPTRWMPKTRWFATISPAARIRWLWHCSAFCVRATRCFACPAHRMTRFSP